MDILNEFDFAVMLTRVSALEILGIDEDEEKRLKERNEEREELNACRTASQDR